MKTIVTQERMRELAQTLIENTCAGGGGYTTTFGPLTLRLLRVLAEGEWEYRTPGEVDGQPRQ